MLKKMIVLIASLLAVPLAAHAATVQLPQTGQTQCYSATGAVIPCGTTGQDAQLRKGVPWPAPRFTDANGTITDNLTGLVWLKNANCFNQVSWNAALTAAATLATGQCGLTDASAAGSWRLPNVLELESLTDLSQEGPTLPAGHPFTGVEPANYWTSTTHAHFTANAWAVSLDDGSVRGDVKSSGFFVLPVRNGQP